MNKLLSLLLLASLFSLTLAVSIVEQSDKVSVSIDIKADYCDGCDCDDEEPKEVIDCVSSRDCATNELN